LIDSDLARSPEG